MLNLNILIVEDKLSIKEWIKKMDLTNNVAKRQHDAIHQAISTTCLNEQECYDALWSYPTWQYEIDFVCNPEKLLRRKASRLFFGNNIL